MHWQLRRELLTNVAAVMGGGLQAALNLDFTTLTPATMATAGVTFSRASLAGQYDSTGKWTFAPNNILLQSEDFGTTWTIPVGGTITTNVATDPLGGSTADQYDSTGTGQGRLQQDVTTSIKKFIFSCYVKQAPSGSATNVRLTTNNTAAWTTGSSTRFALTSSWQLVSIVCTPASADTAIRCMIGRADVDGNDDATCDGKVLVWGAQLEAVTYETSPRTYNATTASAYYGPRFDYNPSTLAAKGLLIEEARTNIALRSDALDNATYWSVEGTSATANSVTSPDGTTSAELINDGTGGPGRHIIFGNVSGTISGNYTFSCYAKDVNRRYIVLALVGSAQYDVYFDLTGVSVTDQNNGATGTITAINNGWYRLTITANLASDTYYPIFGMSDVSNNSGTLSLGFPSYTGSNKQMYIWGAQLEAGAFVTSYISTTSASATRAKDFANITGSNFSSWYNATSGTFIVNAARNHSTNGSGVIAASNGSFNEAIYSTMTFDHKSEVSVRTGSSTVADLLSGNTTSEGSFFKLAYAYASNDFASSLNGGTVVTDASGGLPTVDRLNIGGDAAVWNDWIGWYKSLTYYASRLDNATLQSLTT